MSKLSGLLKRRTPPQAIRNDADLQREEAMSLVRTVLRFAPREEFQEWWPRFEDRLLGEAQTYSWPHAGDIVKAGQSLQPKAVGAKMKWEPEYLKIAADRMNAGEGVGEEWLYGMNAVKLEESRLVNSEILGKYRSALYFSERDVVGDEIARDREADRIKRHAISREHQRTESGRESSVKFKRMESRDYDGAI